MENILRHFNYFTYNCARTVQEPNKCLRSLELLRDWSEHGSYMDMHGNYTKNSFWTAFQTAMFYVKGKY